MNAGRLVIFIVLLITRYDASGVFQPLPKDLSRYILRQHGFLRTNDAVADLNSYSVYQSRQRPQTGQLKRENLLS